MGHTYTSLLYHCTFSTKERRPVLTAEVRERLWPYIAGIAKQNGFKTLQAGGTADHAHLLLSLPSKMDVAKALQLLKGGSSKWVSDTFARQDTFRWQEGYGAFSIGISQFEQTVAYIRNQERHHRRKTFQEEFVEFLERHHIEYDEVHIWD